MKVRLLKSSINSVQGKSLQDGQIIISHNYLLQQFVCIFSSVCIMCVYFYLCIISIYLLFYLLIFCMSAFYHLLGGKIKIRMNFMHFSTRTLIQIHITTYRTVPHINQLYQSSLSNTSPSTPLTHSLTPSLHTTSHRSLHEFSQ